MEHLNRDKLKRLTKLTISIVFYLIASAVTILCRILGKVPRATCVILHYHGVSREDRARFARQMDTAIRVATPIPCDIKIRLDAGKRYVGVTFDDGLSSVFENAVPELVRTRVPATIFVVADLLGGTANWETLGADYVADQMLLSEEQLAHLPADIIRIGSHTLSHPLLTSISKERAKMEITASREKLRNLLNRDVTLFSFPYGAHDEQLIDFCRDAGYERVFTILPRLAFRGPDEFVTGRILVEPHDWPLEFRLKLLGAYRWLPWAFAMKRRLTGRMVAEEGLVPAQKVKSSLLTR